MKLLLLVILVSNICIGATWSYQVKEGKEEGPELKLDAAEKSFEVSGIKCNFTPTQILHEGSVEMRSVVCQIGKYSIYNNVPCFKGQNANNVLHISAEKHASVSLICQH